LTLAQPRCGGRTLVTSRSLYGASDDPVYQVRPLLHEPAPLNISWWQSASGIPVRAGERLALGSHYDGHRPHMRVMGIDHVYLARDAPRRRAPIASSARCTRQSCRSCCACERVRNNRLTVAS
jgi:hypothetical protein